MSLCLRMIRRRSGRLGLVMSGLALLLASSACGTGRIVPRSPDDLRSELLQRGAHEIVVPFEPDGRMRDWLKKTVPRGASRSFRLQALAESLLSERGLGIDYSRDLTATAPEVFENRVANCLSFTHLYAGLARELDIPVYFLEVRDVENYSREGDLIVHSDHIAIGYGPDHDLTIIDFAVQQGTQYRKIRAIDDLTAVALFYSNRGAEHLRHGEPVLAVQWLKSAISIDPQLAPGWVNYGVALRRTGRVAEAEQAYRRALEIDPAEFSAYQNLAALLRIEGQETEALELLAIAADAGNRNPFAYLALGDFNMRHGRADQAARFYRRAVRLTDEQAEPLAALGLWELDNGDSREARRLLKRALRLDPEEPRVRQLSARLGPPPGV
ncbi:MAG TPA: tetratricopeptide repeat protein [Thermoanaerobaculia bacterium]|nr:tetratricopeptide repeat protein [Thermoanaerobaculia bacterium]